MQCALGKDSDKGFTFEGVTDDHASFCHSISLQQLVTCTTLGFVMLYRPGHLLLGYTTLAELLRQYFMPLLKAQSTQHLLTLAIAVLWYTPVPCSWTLVLITSP